MSDTTNSALQARIEALPDAFPATLETVETLRDQALQTTATGPEDKDGLEMVSTARKRARELRLRVERVRKEEKRVVLVYGKAIDDLARSLREPLEEAEGHCKQIEAHVAQELERRAQAKVDQRVAELASLGVNLPCAMVEVVEDGDWDAFLNDQAQQAEERRRLKEEARKEREAYERLAAEAKRSATPEVREVAKAVDGIVQSLTEPDAPPLAAVSEREAVGLPPSSAGGLVAPPADSTEADPIRQAALRLRDTWGSSVDRCLLAHSDTKHAAHALFALLQVEGEGGVKP